MLTEKQRQFVAEYVVDFNGAKAAERAGYGVSGARCEAARLLANVNVRTEVNKALEERGQRAQLTAERVIEELMRIAFADIKSVATWTENGITFMPSVDVDDNASAAISEVTEKTTPTKFGNKTILRIKMHDKMRAIELLAKHLGMLRDKEDDEKFRGMSMADLVVLVKAKLPELEGVR